MRRLIPLLVPLVLLMAACGSGDDDSASATTPPPATSGPAPPSTPTVPPTTSGRTFTTVPGAVTPRTSVPPAPPGSTTTGGTDEQQAVADLAARYGVDPSDITTVSVDEVTWRSGAIGCPQPDMLYTQALVPGTRVVLELEGTQYEYHAGGGRSIFLCEEPETPVDG
jgi:hypothetical protein